MLKATVGIVQTLIVDFNAMILDDVEEEELFDKSSDICDEVPKLLKYIRDLEKDLEKAKGKRTKAEQMATNANKRKQEAETETNDLKNKNSGYWSFIKKVSQYSPMQLTNTRLQTVIDEAIRLIEWAR